MKKQHILTLGLIVMFLGTGELLAFTEPSQSPPNGNVSAPIHGSAANLYVPYFNASGVLTASTLTSNGASATANGNFFVTGNLDIVGLIKIAGGTPGSGKVLTSDASGNATWQTPVTSGGDITGVAAGTGLSGGGTSGDVTISLPTRLDSNSASGNGGYISSGNYGGTGSAAYFPSGFWANGATNWLYGETYADTIYDHQDSGYYLNPASNSIFNTVRIAGGSPGSGKVLTSDASGNATWTTLPASSGGTITGVTAGTNLSGGGTSGSVTLNVVNNPTFSGDTTGQNMYTDTINSINAGDPLEINYRSTSPTKICATVNCGTYSAYFGTNGNVGIGTQSPAQKLVVNGGEANFGNPTYTDPAPGVIYDAKFGGPNRGIAVTGDSFFNGTARVGTVTTTGNGPWGGNNLSLHTTSWPGGTTNGDYAGLAAGHGYFYGGLQSGGPGGGEAASGQLYVAGTSMLLGSVGVGTASPSYKLDVSGDIRATNSIVAGSIATNRSYGGTPGVQYCEYIDPQDGGEPFLSCTTQGGSGGYYVNSALGDPYKGAAVYGETNYAQSSGISGVRGVGVWVGVKGENTIGSGGYGVYGVCPTTNNNCYGVMSSNGVYGTGLRSGFRLVLQSDRNMALYDGSSAIWASGTQVSDIRLKKDILPLGTTLDDLSKLSVVRFHYTGDMADGDKDHIGLIAQEVEKIYPDFVYTDSQSGRKLLQYDKLTSVLVQAVKDLKTKNDALEARISALEAKLK